MIKKIHNSEAPRKLNIDKIEFILTRGRVSGVIKRLMSRGSTSDLFLMRLAKNMRAMSDSKGWIHPDAECPKTGARVAWASGGIPSRELKKHLHPTA